MLTLGTIVAIVFLSICALALIAGVIAFFAEEPAAGAALIASAIVVAFISQIGFMVIGYNGDYMRYTAVNGTVTDVASRQVSNDNGMSTRYVFRINGQDYGVDDTRAALVKAGDTATLNCKKEFVWGSTNNGWACNWG